MQYFHTCSKINDNNPIDEMKKMQKCLLFLYFQYKRMKMQGLNNNLI
jgi:hypothetical protein